MAAMRAEASQFCLRHPRCEIISLGSIKFDDRELARSRERQHTKTILLPREPSLSELTRRIRFSTAMLPVYVRHQGDFNLDLRTAAGPLQAIARALVPELGSLSADRSEGVDLVPVSVHDLLAQEMDAPSGELGRTPATSAIFSGSVEFALSSALALLVARVRGHGQSDGQCSSNAKQHASSLKTDASATDTCGGCAVVDCLFWFTVLMSGVSGEMLLVMLCFDGGMEMDRVAVCVGSGDITSVWRMESVACLAFVHTATGTLPKDIRVELLDRQISCVPLCQLPSSSAAKNVRGAAVLSSPSTAKRDVGSSVLFQFQATRYQPTFFLTELIQRFLPRAGMHTPLMEMGDRNYKGLIELRRENGRGNGRELGTKET